MRLVESNETHCISLLPVLAIISIALYRMQYRTSDLALLTFSISVCSAATSSCRQAKHLAQLLLLMKQCAKLVRQQSRAELFDLSSLFPVPIPSFIEKSLLC